MTDPDRTAHKGEAQSRRLVLSICPDCVDKGLARAFTPKDVAVDGHCVVCGRSAVQLEMVGLLRRLESGDADNEDRDAAIVLLLRHALG